MEVQFLDPNQIELDPDNVRKHSDESVEKLAAGLEHFGQMRTVTVWNNRVIAGNGIVLAARSLGWDSLSCTVVDSLSEEDAKAYAIADNRLAELSSWDSPKLIEQLTGFPSGFAELVGFTSSDLIDLNEAVNIEKLLASDNKSSKQTDAEPSFDDEPADDLPGEEPKKKADDKPKASTASIPVAGSVLLIENIKLAVDQYSAAHGQLTTAEALSGICSYYMDNQ